MNKEEFSELAAGFALNALTPDDERVFVAALVAHPEWRAIVEDDSATVAALASTVAFEAPPAGIRKSLLAAVAQTPQESPTSTDTDSSVPLTTDAILRPVTVPITVIAPRAQRIWFGLAAAAALVLVLGFGAGRLGEYMQRPASVVALEQIEQAPDSRTGSVVVETGGTVTAAWSESLGSAVVSTKGLAALNADQTYELWVIRDDVPVAAGTFDTSSGLAVAIVEGEVNVGDVIAVTIEPAGGSPDGVPSGDPIAAIPAV